jgi:SAM-dependent methyltransferase
MRAKQVFLENSLRDLRPHRVLDIGCNTGFFSFIAARSGARVVAIDYDEAVVGQVYREAKKEELNVLPLVVNISRPTPRLGWCSSENPSFLDRAVGRFDLVMMLAVVHHMLVTERIPLREVIRVAAELTTKNLIIEYVPPDDKMFRRLLRGRDYLHEAVTVGNFVHAVSEFFHIVRSETLPESERQMFLLEKK